jgi:hypothetical protein
MIDPNVLVDEIFSRLTTRERSVLKALQIEKLSRKDARERFKVPYPRIQGVQMAALARIASRLAREKVPDDEREPIMQEIFARIAQTQN